MRISDWSSDVCSSDLRAGKLTRSGCGHPADIAKTGKRMFGAIAKAIFGSSNDRYVKSMRPLVAKINALEPQFEAMGDEELQNQTQLLKARLAEGEKLDDILDRKSTRLKSSHYC